MSDPELNRQSGGYSPLRLVGILTITCFCTLLLIVATFTRLKCINCFHGIETMLHPENFLGTSSVFTLKPYFYVPQVPVVLFTAALLGSACGMTAVFLYIVIGLAFLPVFGLGGGFDYVMQYTFGYILAFIPAALFAGKIVGKTGSVKNLLKAAFVGVLIIHVAGLLYMLLIATVKHESWIYIRDWLFFESFIKMFYDFSIGFLFMLIAKIFKKFIWILTAA